jgi:hypothetical protein
VVLSLKLSQYSKQLPVADLVAVLQEQRERGYESLALVGFKRVGCAKDGRLLAQVL